MPYPIDIPFLRIKFSTKPSACEHTNLVSVIVAFSSAAVARDTLGCFFPERDPLQIRATLAMAACLGFSFSIYSSAALPGTIWAKWNVPISCPNNRGAER